MEQPQDVASAAGGQSRSNVGLGGERFAPRVMLNGRAVTPTGWMWVVGFALAGCEWAIEEASKPEFRECMADWMRERKRAEAEAEIGALEKRIAEIRARITTPNAS